MSFVAARAIDWFKRQFDGGPLGAYGYRGDLAENVLLPTTVGAAKPSAVVPETMAAGDNRFLHVISVDGIAARLSVLAEKASDSASGMITTLANSQDAHAKDLQKQIDDWTVRLASRQATLTAQFNAMETALGTIQNQSTWLTSQINSLPSWSSSKN